MIDLSVVRLHDTSREVPPEGWFAPPGLQELSSSGSSEHEQTHHCPMCEEPLRSIRGLVSHLRVVHGAHRLISRCVPINVCSWCSSTFRSRQVARHHAERAFATGKCRCDQASWPWEWEAFPGLRCGVCGVDVGSETTLWAHIKGHLPEPAPTLELGLRGRRGP
jgi:hypothetical protein